MLGPPWWTSHRSLFCLDGAGYRVVSGAPTSQGQLARVRLVLGNKSDPVALILMGG